jgi:hypothetical protein
MDALVEQQYIGAYPDESDRASAIVAILNEDALREARKLAQPETHPDFDGSHCCAGPDFSGHEFGVKPCQEKGAWNAE